MTQKTLTKPFNELTPQADENGLHSFEFWFLIKLYGDKLLDGNQYFENFEVVINKDNLEGFNV